MRLPLPFPHLFHPRRLPGRRDGGAVSQGSAEAASVPILTRMANSNAIQPFIEHSTDQFESESSLLIIKGISTSSKYILLAIMRIEFFLAIIIVGHYQEVPTIRCARND